MEVNLLEDCLDDDGVIGGDIISPEMASDGFASPSCTSAKGLEVDVDTEDMELDKEDLLRMQMNEAMRKAREGSDSPINQAPRCEVVFRYFSLIKYFSKTFIYSRC